MSQACSISTGKTYGLQRVCRVWNFARSKDNWEDFVHLMQPATVKKWHSVALRYFWRWKSRRKAGRPPISQEMQDIIYKLSKENRLWGAERSRDVLCCE